MKKIKIDIWSDIQCPFCYIGKRHLEAALEDFPEAQEVQIEWHSYQLDPELPKPASKLNLYHYLAERKGISLEESVKMHEYVTEMARNAGLNYDFSKAVVANSFDAHRLIQFAKTKGLGDAAEERLFKAYFTEGRDMSDADTLTELGKEIGLNESELRQVTETDAFSDEVRKDIYEAQQAEVRGVPFFVFNDKYSVSGAQPVTVFRRALDTVWKEAGGL